MKNVKVIYDRSVAIEHVKKYAAIFESIYDDKFFRFKKYEDCQPQDKYDNVILSDFDGMDWEIIGSADLSEGYVYVLLVWFDGVSYELSHTTLKNNLDVSYWDLPTNMKQEVHNMTRYSNSTISPN